VLNTPGGGATQGYFIYKWLGRYKKVCAFSARLNSSSIALSFANLFCSILESSLSLRVLAFFFLSKSRSLVSGFFCIWGWQWENFLLIASDTTTGTSHGKYEDCFSRTDATVLDHRYPLLSRETL
jgi:hypothetical protein